MIPILFSFYPLIHIQNVNKDIQYLLRRKSIESVCIVFSLSIGIDSFDGFKSYLNNEKKPVIFKNELKQRDYYR